MRGSCLIILTIVAVFCISENIFAAVETYTSTESCFNSKSQKVPCPNPQNPTITTPIYSNLELAGLPTITYDATYNSTDFSAYVETLAYNTFKNHNGTHWYSPQVLSQPSFWTSFEANFPRNDIVQIINVTKSGLSYNNENIIASAYVIRGQGHTTNFFKPVIVSDGFDPGNTRTIIELIAYQQFNRLLSTDAGKPLALGYDLIFVDYHEGAGDIQLNAKAFLKITESVCSQANGNKVIVAGFSMGGLIARLALLYAEKFVPDQTKNIIKYIAIDSPLQGAAVPLDMQKAVWNCTYNPLASYADKAIGTFQMGRAYNDLCRAAAFQMVYTHFSCPTDNRSKEHDRFYDFLKNTMGDYPKRPWKCAIADAQWQVPYPGVSPGVWAGRIDNNDIHLEQHDLAPGTYFDHFKGGDFYTLFGNSTIGMNTAQPPAPSTDPWYKPTFVPIYSAFDLRGIDMSQYPNVTTQSQLDQICSKYSPFKKLYIVNFNKRYEHIVFNDELCNTIVQALNQPTSNISPILNLLLND